MMPVHECGKGSVDSYPYVIVVTKGQADKARAKEEGFLFRMTVEAQERYNPLKTQ